MAKKYDVLQRAGGGKHPGSGQSQGNAEDKQDKRLSTHTSYINLSKETSRVLRQWEKWEYPEIPREHENSTQKD